MNGRVPRLHANVGVTGNHVTRQPSPMSSSKNAKKNSAGTKPYKETLEPVVRARYLDKLSSIGSFDPYELVDKEWNRPT